MKWHTPVCHITDAPRLQQALAARLPGMPESARPYQRFTPRGTLGLTAGGGLLDRARNVIHRPMKNAALARERRSKLDLFEQIPNP